ncbi:hypothetical protein J4210_02615 [Candidatus Woesearchaeota archaeon]|nr:hypothetical protein [Candidatus Woesearchaeota archaeon]
MNTKGTGVIELIIFLIIVVVTSATVLLLIKFNVVEVKTAGAQESVLNAEFIPYVREGTLVVKEFSFCRSVDETYNCLGPESVFTFGQPVYYRFGVESSTYQGQIKVVKNYRIKGPSGEVLLDVGTDQQYQVDVVSNNDREVVLFTDYFVVPAGFPVGEYTFELVVENPLLTKQATLVQRFVVGEGVEG